jgi:hypothetical protein
MRLTLLVPHLLFVSSAPADEFVHHAKRTKPSGIMCRVFRFNGKLIGLAQLKQELLRRRCGARSNNSHGVELHRPFVMYFQSL